MKHFFFTIFKRILIFIFKVNKYFCLYLKVIYSRNQPANSQISKSRWSHRPMKRYYSANFVTQFSAIVRWYNDIVSALYILLSFVYFFVKRACHEKNLANNDDPCITVLSQMSYNFGTCYLCKNFLFLYNKRNFMSRYNVNYF